MIKISRIKGMLLVALIFLSLANTLTNLQLDKLAFVLLALAGAWLLRSRPVFSWDGAVVLSLLLVALVISYLSSLVNYETVWHDSYLLLFFLIITWVISSCAVGNPRYFLNGFLFASAIYFLFGIGAWFYSQFTGEVHYVMPLYGKGRPDIFAALSFATTPQVYASVAALASIVALKLKATAKSGSWYNVIILLALLAIVISLNRVWLLYIPIILVAWGGRRVILAIVALGVLLGGFLFFYSNVAFSFGTVSSRVMMLEHMLSFINEQSLLDLLLGNPFYIDSYFFMHGQDFYYIESAPVYLVTKFGVLGLLISMLLLVYWLVKLSQKDVLLALFSVYYLVFVQMMTHEFFSISFWLYWVVFLCLFFLKKREINQSKAKHMEHESNESSLLRQA
ncbi:hypothetical protein VRRI112168_07335 [Vreelandella rituensis]|uniref:Uncharacterized protein n=2 Tax=Vreelandella rituensis TaxID=2282306 RepID=A0A368U6P5_9GAMM|nr:hypothetical protein DU506_09305 [Halomonas rituensis]